MKRLHLIFLVTIFVRAFLPARLHAQVFEHLYSFENAIANDLANTPNKGRGPVGLTFGSDGFFYGVCAGSSYLSDAGSIFRMSRDGEVTRLAEFTANSFESGDRPMAPLTEGTDGNFYGTTQLGGASLAGTVFRITPQGDLTTLAEFQVNGPIKGGAPVGALVQGADGSFYGTTSGVAPNGDFGVSGTVFKITPQGALTTLVEFTGNGATNKGSQPQGGLVLGGDGNYYGTTLQGGVNGKGTVFKMTPAGVLTTLVNFGGAVLGANPGSGLIQAADGFFYGTTTNGGTGDFGTVFKMTASGAVTTLVQFSGATGPNKGSYPLAALVQAADGNFYGSTSGGGSTGYGTVFRMTPQGSLTTLSEFTGGDGPRIGAYPQGALVRAGNGELFGCARAGGLDFVPDNSFSEGNGVVFRIAANGSTSTVVEFTGAGRTVHGTPFAGLAQGSDGFFYGTTRGGGAAGKGTVFKMSSFGVLSTIAEFDGVNGGKPSTALLQASDGNFYGVTDDEFENTAGCIYKVTPAGEITPLHFFSGSIDGFSPRGGLVQGPDGSLYGSMSEGGESFYGTIFKTTLGGVYTKLHDFDFGQEPNGKLLLASDGNFYGTTRLGGQFADGTLFKMTPAGALSTLASFSSSSPGTAGGRPNGIVLGSDSDFHGTTQLGAANGSGRAFSTGISGSFANSDSFAYEHPPSGELVEGSDGAFYGVTSLGGADGEGTVFQLDGHGQLTYIVQSGLGYPSAGLVKGTDGNLYGVTPKMAYRLIFPGKPLVEIANANPQHGNTVLLQARVNARGVSTSVTLEYGFDGASFPNSVPVDLNLSTYRSWLTGTVIGSAAPGEVLYYRFRASSSQGTSVTPVATYTSPSVPFAITAPPTEVTSTSARFQGIVNAMGVNTNVEFQWGTDGNLFPNTAAGIPASVAGNADAAVSAPVAGLPEGGNVYYRIRASSSEGEVISGVQSFSTVNVTTNTPQPDSVGVATAIFRATLNTFGRTASVRFRYWPQASPTEVLETTAQSFTSTEPQEVTAEVSGLLENTTYVYQVSVTIGDTQTLGSTVSFTSQLNAPPVAVDDVYFYDGQIPIYPLENDSDPNNPAASPNAGLTLAQDFVVPPNAAIAAANRTGDTSIDYIPQFNVRAEDSLVYRVLDNNGGSATARVRFIAFAGRAALYGGKIDYSSGDSPRMGSVAVQLSRSGAISTSFMNWPNASEGFPESFVLKGQFDQRGRLSRTFNSPSGSQVTISLALDPDQPRILGSFEERVDNVVTASVPTFELTLNAGTGGLAASGLRTGYINPPTEFTSSMADGFVRVTIGKDKSRGARFAGRLPDGEPFLAGAKAQGRTYVLARNLEQGGLLTGLIRAIDLDDSTPGGMMANLYWEKKASSRAKYERNALATNLSLSGVAYPALAKDALPPIGLGVAMPNARLRFTGGGLAGTYRDLLLHFLPGGVQIVGPDMTQTGEDIPLAKLKIKSDSSKAAFSGKFTHPLTGKPVKFEGAFRVPFDGQPGDGRGVFRGPASAGGVIVKPIHP